MNKDKLSLIPHTPGIYLMRTSSGEIIYIGKAIDLAKRVRSYFTKKVNTPLPSVTFLSNVKVVDYIIAESERDALILENRLIKKLQPKYNVLWRDDKSYPHLKVTLDEDFPRVLLTRQIKKDGSKYFGPYHNTGEIKKLLRWLGKTFNIRQCKIDFRYKNLPDGKRVQGCVYYHIQQCRGPCLGKVAPEEYRKNIDKLLMFLEGKYTDLIRILEKEMHKASGKLLFEDAKIARDNIRAIDRMFEKISFREANQDDIVGHIKITRALSQIKDCLGLPKVPVTIEAFDVSNIYGKESTGSMVRFYKGEPDKNNYRKYKIKTVSGIDDYSMIREIVERRYSRLIKENRKLPDFILIDGGRGHLESARGVLEKLKLKHLPVASLAKSEETIFIDDKQINLPQDSPALLLLEHIRDESHRFALKYHRERRKKVWGRF